MPGTVRGQLKQDVAAELGLDYEVDVLSLIHILLLTVLASIAVKFLIS